MPHTARHHQPGRVLFLPQKEEPMVVSRATHIKHGLQAAALSILLCLSGLAMVWYLTPLHKMGW